jgi:hypothetical protein
MTNNQLNKAVETLDYVRFPLKMLSQPWASNADVVVYAFMLNRFTFFKGLNKEYYENIDQIALACGQSPITVKRTLKKLQEHDYVVVGKVKAEVGVSNKYIVKDIYAIMQSESFVKTSQLPSEDPDWL